MIKYLTAILVSVIAVLVLALAWAFATIRNDAVQAGVLRADLKALTEAQERAVERRKKDLATLVARERKLASKARELAEAQEALYTALQREKTWSDTDVPDTVQTALQGDSGGSNFDPASLLDRENQDGNPKP